MARFHFAGRFNGDKNSLHEHEHEEDYTAFRETEDLNKHVLIMNGIAIAIAVVTLAIYFFRSGKPMNFIGTLLSLVVLVPHEFLHAICFEGDVYMYENLKKGMLFVTGPGTFSKSGFIFMSMLPNIVFGFIPFILFLINPSWTVLGTLGALSIPAGGGDYYNIYNCITQVPANGRVYNNGMHTYWYIPKEK